MCAHLKACYRRPYYKDFWLKLFGHAECSRKHEHSYIEKQSSQRVSLLVGWISAVTFCFYDSTKVCIVGIKAICQQNHRWNLTVNSMHLYQVGTCSQLLQNSQKGCFMGQYPLFIYFFFHQLPHTLSRAASSFLSIVWGPQKPPPRRLVVASRTRRKPQWQKWN